MSFDLESLMDDMLAGVGGSSGETAVSDVGDADVDGGEVFDAYDIEEMGDVEDEVVVDAEDVQDAVPAAWVKPVGEKPVLSRGLSAMLNNTSGATTVVTVSPVRRVATVVEQPKRLENSIVQVTGDHGRDRVVKQLGWDVQRTPLFLPDGKPVKSHVAQVRSDNGGILGVVTTGFSTIQNDELIQLADAVSNGSGLKFANAGVVDGGSRVFFQCQGESFDVGDGDEISPYVLFCNGHDGSLSCRMIPMTHRMKCQNQLGNIVRNCVSYAVIRHTGDVKEKLAEAGRLGKLYFATVKANREAMMELRNTGVKTQDLQKFFHGVYEKHFGVVQMDAKTEAQERAVEKIKDGFGQFMMRFEKEKSLAGTTAWNMANAYTWWLQHCKGVGRNPQKTAQRRMESALFGVSAGRSVEAFKVALEMAG